MRELNKIEKDELMINPIPQKTWLNHYQILWTAEENGNVVPLAPNDENVDPITMTELLEKLKSFKNRKSPGGTI